MTPASVLQTEARDLYITLRAMPRNGNERDAKLDSLTNRAWKRYTRRNPQHRQLAATQTFPIAPIAALLPVFDAASKAACEGKRLNGRVLDPCRVSRAFLLLTLGDAPAKWREYATVSNHCMCEDWKRGNCCKHVISKAINDKALNHG